MKQGTQKMRSETRRTQGVALFQTLLITAMLALIAIGFSQRTQDHVGLAQRLEERTRAALLANSALQEVLFVLLTESAPPAAAGPCQDSDAESGPLEPAFNRYGAPFCLGPQVTLAIQDLSGLLPVFFPAHPSWARTLAGLGASEPAIDAILGRLSDFQDQDRNAFIIGETEPETLPSGRPYANALAQRPSLLGDLVSDKPLHDRLLKFAHLKGRVELNPLFSPSALLNALLGPEMGAIASSERQPNAPQMAFVRASLGAQDDPEAFLFTEQSSSRLLLTVTVNRLKVEVNRSIIVDLALGAKRPLQVLSHGKF
jgi:hypothetical protein